LADANKCIFTGRLVADPEMRFDPSGKAITKFRIACNGFKKENPATFISLVSFDKKAEICGEYLKKGSLVYLETRYQNRSYEKDGVKQYVSEFLVDTVNNLTPKAQAQDQAQAQSADNGMYDDIPFT